MSQTGWAKNAHLVSRRKKFQKLGFRKPIQSAGVNTLIGKNNSGKSNVLAAVDVAIGQLKLGQVASDWPLRGRAIDEFNARDKRKRIQIALTLEIPTSIGEQIKQLIADQIEGIEVALDKIKDTTRLSGGLRRNTEAIRVSFCQRARRKSTG